MNIENALLETILKRYKNLYDIYDYSIVDNTLIILCNVRTHTPSFVVSGDDVSYMNYAYNNDLKFNHNKHEYGPGLAIVDLKYNELVKLYYFQELEMIDDRVTFVYKNKDFIILEFEFRTYILYLKDFSIMSFGGNLIKIYEPYIITFPYIDYFSSDVFCLTDTRTKNIVNLYDVLPLKDLLPIDLDVLDGGYGNLLSDNLYIIDNKLIFIDPRTKIEYAIFLDVILGKTKMEKMPNVFGDNVCKLKDIKEISPYRGVSLGELALNNLEHDGCNIISERSSYVAKLMFQIKYQFRKDKIRELAQITTRELSRKIYGTFDVIIPVPSSNPNKDYQPLNEVVQIISNKLNVPYDLGYLLSKEREPVRTINDSNTRNNILEDSLYISDINKYRDKRILLIDDHIYKGDTVKACISKCCCSDIFVLVITRNYELSEIM